MPDDGPFEVADRKIKPCPICRKAPTTAYAPFCSKRCADVDLHRWFKGGYAVPADEPGQSVPDNDPEDG